MFKFKKSYYIDRPQQEVFDYATDPTNDTKWRESAVSSEWISEGPVGVGSKLRSVDKLLGRKIESVSEISAWDPPNEYGQKADGGPVPFELMIRLQPEGSGTRLDVEGQAEIGGFFKMAEGLAGKQFEKQFDADFNGLKRVLEGG
ncbi:MAG TPA: SRPBCC family protein [Anaerolineales bacterium]|nr:SRPBCC family protein [Anaerolineales bacterium]